jgi:hypothetical protein
MLFSAQDELILTHRSSDISFYSLMFRQSQSIFASQLYGIAQFVN